MKQNTAISGDIETYRKALLTPGALSFLALLQSHFGDAWTAEREKGILFQEKASQVPVEDFTFRKSAASQAIRDGDWRILHAELLENRYQPGITLVSPAAPDMIVKAMTTEERYGSKPVSNMFDFEDAYHLGIHAALSGQLALKQLNAGYIKVGGSASWNRDQEYIYDIKRHGSNIVRIRINGFDAPPVEEIKISGRALERSFLDFGLHCYHVAQAQNASATVPAYLLPKMEYDRAVLWAKVLQFTERTLGLKDKAIKVSIICETIRGCFELDEMLWTLSGGSTEDIARLRQGETVTFPAAWVEAINFGSHDLIFSCIKNHCANPGKIYPQFKDEMKCNPAAETAWDLISETAHTRGIVPVGSMTVALTSAPTSRENAVKITESKLLKQHQHGSVQAWEAMPDTTVIANRIMRHPVRKMDIPKMVHYLKADYRYGKQRSEKARQAEKTLRQMINTAPAGDVTEKAAYENIHKSLEYIESWLRGGGVISYRSPLKGKTDPLMMQNIATTERARCELWTWLRHGIVFTDSNKKFTPTLFIKLLSDALRDIRNAICADHPAKGKMSVHELPDGLYDEAAELFSAVVLNERHCISTITGLLYHKYRGIAGD